MIAKQLLIAASLVVLVGRARAQSAPPSAQPDDEATSAPGNTPATAPPIKPKPPTGTFALGAGYDTDDGFGLNANVTQSNLFGTGKLLSLDAEINERMQHYELRFASPELLGTGFTLDAKIYNDVRDYEAFTRQAAGASVGLSHWIAPHVKAYASYRVEHVTEELTNTPIPIDGWGNYPYNLAAVRVGVEYNTLSEPFMATHGSRAGAYVDVAGRELGSDVSLVRTKSFAETHQAIGAGAILHVGGSFETVSGDSLPSGELLHFDGSSQIRGISPDKFGPQDGYGAHLGGTMAFYGHADLEVPLSHRIGLSAVGFVDGGGLFDGGTGELAASTGFGLVWRSPIGPIAAYWAYPSIHAPPQFVFGVGTSF